MGFSTNLALALDGSLETHEAMVAALRSDSASEWSDGAAIATIGQVTAAAIYGYTPPDGAFLSSQVTDGIAVLVIVIYDSDFAQVDAFVAGETVASACFGLEGMMEMMETIPDRDSSDDIDEADTSVPPEPIEGKEWWIARRPDTSSGDLDELVSEGYVFVEEQVAKFLAPLGVPSDAIMAFAPDLIAEPGSATVTAV